tara:strand:+ start:670 stop:1266 length:597 start_codon:yes stop_codon:yes gene_type:complete
MSFSRSQFGFLSAMAAVPVSLMCSTATTSLAAEIKIKINTSGRELKQLASSGEADPCFIHAGCKKGVGFSQKGSMGAGWYCEDGQLVGPKTNYDQCNIASGCTSDKHSVQYGPVWKSQEHALPRVVGRSWQCYDNAFIHRGCEKGAVYVKNGTMGTAWYCNDGKKVESSTLIDTAFIQPGCQEGVEFDKSISAWRCKF